MKKTLLISSLFFIALVFLPKSWGQYAYVDNNGGNDKLEDVPEINKYRFHKINKDTISLGVNDILVCDSFCAQGMPSTYDALHSFNYRRMDRFGGYLNVKVNKGLEQIRNNGFDSDIKNLFIQIDPVSLKVYWFAVLGPSTDGRSYVRVDSRGSAGGGISAVEKQLPRMHGLYPDMKPYKLIEFNENVKVCYDWNGNQLCDFRGTVNIRQHFFKYAAKDNAEVTPVTDPTIVKVETVNTAPGDVIPSEITPVKPVVKPTPKPKPKPKPKYKTYKVKSGDTLSEIAEKFHVPLSKLKKANNLRSDKIKIGQTLKIPK
ncbi:MAG: LysM peptidoglycan-binding domain-containing protein [Crocinitomicaceae bacterium]